MTNIELRAIRAAVEINPDLEHWRQIHADERRVEDARRSGEWFPIDLPFSGRYARVWWETEPE